MVWQKAETAPREEAIIIGYDYRDVRHYEIVFPMGSKYKWQSQTGKVFTKDDFSCWAYFETAEDEMFEENE